MNVATQTAISVHHFWSISVRYPPPRGFKQPRPSGSLALGFSA